MPLVDDNGRRLTRFEVANLRSFGNSPELGYCKYCMRVRWLEVIEKDEIIGPVEGKCTQCVREGAE